MKVSSRCQLLAARVSAWRSSRVGDVGGGAEAIEQPVERHRVLLVRRGQEALDGLPGGQQLGQVVVARQVPGEPGHRQAQLVLGVVAQRLQGLLPGDLGGLPHAQRQAGQPDEGQQQAQPATTEHGGRGAGHASGVGMDWARRSERWARVSARAAASRFSST